MPPPQWAHRPVLSIDRAYPLLQPLAQRTRPVSDLDRQFGRVGEHGAGLLRLRPCKIASAALSKGVRRASLRLGSGSALRQPQDDIVVALAQPAHGGEAVEDAPVERYQIASLPVGAGVDC
jgi:hypothetical protein